jgi:hypothetical protein
MSEMVQLKGPQIGPVRGRKFRMLFLSKTNDMEVLQSDIGSVRPQIAVTPGAVSVAYFRKLNFSAMFYVTLRATRRRIRTRLIERLGRVRWTVMAL